MSEKETFEDIYEVFCLSISLLEHIFIIAFIYWLRKHPNIILHCTSYILQFGNYSYIPKGYRQYVRNLNIMNININLCCLAWFIILKLTSFVKKSRNDLFNNYIIPEGGGGVYWIKKGEGVAFFTLKTYNVMFPNCKHPFI